MGTPRLALHPTARQAVPQRAGISAGILPQRQVYFPMSSPRSGTKPSELARYPQIAGISTFGIFGVLAVGV